MTATDWFVHDRFGMFIHFGLSAIAARDLSWPMSWERIPTARWRQYVPEFNPDLGGPRDWVRMAKRTGARYCVMTVKHHEGFCLWDSQLTTYTSVQAPACRRDLAREFVDACHEEGIRPGFYLSLIDWDHPDYTLDHLHPERDDPASRARPRQWSRYVDYLHAQARELLSNYGQIDVLWLDYSYADPSGDKSGEAWRADELVAMVRSLQPGIIIDNRLVAGHEDPGAKARHGDFSTPEQVIPADGVRDADGRPVVWESCMTLGNAWGYHAEDTNFKSPTAAVRMLIECVAKGGNLLLNIGPNARGRVRPAEAAAFQAIGDWMELHRDSIVGAGPAVVGGVLLPKPQWGWYTRRGDVLYAHLVERPAGPIPLLGLGGKVVQARWLHDGAEISMQKTWNAVRGDAHAVLNVKRADLPDAIASVVALRLAPGM
jgi:alpha-L-fucosidase